jgi:nicotinate phosphoribosyltransferase
MIINSLLDTDLYKFTMMQVVLHHFPEAQVEYRFKCRTPGVDLTPYIAEIERELAGLCGLRFVRRELSICAAGAFSERLRRSARPVSPAGSFVDVRRSATSPNEIEIAIIGPWLHTILFEVPVLAIVSGIFRNTAATGLCRGQKASRCKDRANQRRSRPGILAADYGTRRRFPETGRRK